MSPQPRRRPGTYRPPRDRREIAIAVLSAVSVVVLTAALLFVLRPRDDDPSSPPVQTPLPTDETVPPVELVPDPAVPPDEPAPDTLAPEGAPAP